MAFSKKFPKDVEGSNYPEWKEIILTDEEEGQAEEEASKPDINDQSKYLVDQKIEVLKSLN